MNPDNGQYVSFSTLADKHPDLTPATWGPLAADHLGIPEDQMVELRASEDAVKRLSHRVALGEAELQRRKARRKQQKASRKNNR